MLNKADLSAQGAERIKEACHREGLPLLASIPFIPGVVHAVSQARVPLAELEEFLGPTWDRLKGL